MTVEIVNGIKVSQHVSEMSHLDRILDEYTKQAEKYFKAEYNLEKAPKDLREERQRELDRIKEDLNSQKMHAYSIASAEAKLDSYRAEARKKVKEKRARDLLKEKHHPTEILELFMREAGKPKPDSKCTAHHIVPGKGRLEINYFTRVHLHMKSIGINDPDNGVYLPAKKAYTPHWQMPSSLGHKEYHTDGYEEFINERLTMKNTEQQVRMELNLIGRMLQDNNLPPKARRK